MALLMLLVSGVSAQTFQSAAVQTVNGTPRIMATGDFNRDGKADVVYQDIAPGTFFTGGTLHVMLGNGDGTFRDVQQIALPLDVGARITVADLNDDGFPDLIIGYYGFDSNFTPVEFTALINAGDGSFGQPIFSPFPSPDEPATATYHIAVADFDGDGKMDFIFAGSAGLVLMQGDGAGHFNPQVLLTPQSDGDGANDVYVGDFNEDRRADVAIDADFGVYYALNLGGGKFGPVTTIAQVLTNPPLGFGIADVNGDGHQDIVYGGNAEVYVAFGKGDGTFASPRASGIAATSSGYSYLALVDVNGDGRTDIVTSEGGSPVVQLQGTSGQFGYSYGDVPAVGDIGFLAPVYADFDGDGIGDVVTGATGALVFSKGRSDGTFNGARAVIAGAVLDIQPTDLNGDGFVDVAILTGSGSYFGSLYTYLGDGTGEFTEDANPPNPFPTFAGQSSVADFNGDGIPDVFNAGYLLEGDGRGGLLPAVLIAAPAQGSEPEGFTVAADFNEDGIPDAVTTTLSVQVGNACALAVGLSSGAGTWTTQQINLPMGGSSFGSGICAGPLVTADLNGDGHKDLATASISSIYTYMGDGKGNFTPGPVIPIGYTATGYGAIQSGQNDMEAADLDGDGNIDLIVPIADKNVIQIFYGRGDGTFEPAVSLPTAQDVRYVTVADMNGDGIPDMILGGHALVRILHGVGNRAFEATPTSFAGNPYPQKVRVADVNNDGNPDLLVPNGGYSSILEPGETFTVLLNAAPPTSPNLLLPALLCAPEPSAIGQAFSCTATFTPAHNAATPMGVVSFVLDGVAAGSAPLAGNKAVVAFPSTLTAGRHAISASFPGDANFAAAMASTSHFVSLATASIVLTGPMHVAFGQAVPLQVAISGGFGVPTGTATFNDGSTRLGQAGIAAGTGAYTTSSLSAGTHTLQATYSGDGTYAGGVSNTLTVVVDAEPTSIVLQALPSSAPFGSTITLKATVSAAVGPLSGTVQYFDGGTQIGMSAIDAGGSTQFATSSLGLGVHTLTAKFVATASLGPSTSAGVQVTITGVPTQTSLSATPNPSYPGQTVVLQANVTAALVAQPLVGAVRFLDGTTTLGEAPVSAAGLATLSISTLAVGTHTIAASYLGSMPLLPSQSNAVQQVVLNSSFTLAVEPPKITLQTQHHTTFSLTVTPVGLFSGTVTLGCGPLPEHATCRIKQPKVMLTTAGGAQTVSVYLDTSDVIGYASNEPGLLARRGGEILSAVLLLPFFAGCGLARRKHGSMTMKRLVLMAAVFYAVALGSTGCSGKYPASVAPGDYTLNFTGSSNTPPVSQTAALQLTVTE